MRFRWLVAALAAVLVVGGGAFAAMRLLAPANDDAVSLVPSDAGLYVNVFLDPSAQQKMALRDLLERFPEAAATSGGARRAVDDAVDAALEDSGLSFSDDIEPWLGRQVALFASGASAWDTRGAVLVHTHDAEAALEAARDAAEAARGPISDRSHEGIDYQLAAGDDTAFGIVDSFLVVGSRAGFEAVVDTAGSGRSLEDAPRFKRATRDLAKDRLALFYADPSRFLEASGRSELATAALPPSLTSGLERPISGVAFARADGLVLESSWSVLEDADSVPFVDAGDGDLLPSLPGKSWVAVSLDDLGGSVSSLLDAGGEAQGGAFGAAVEGAFRSETGLDLRRDVLAWMGDVGLFVQGENLFSIEGGAVIETTDRRRAAATVAAIGRLIERRGGEAKPIVRGSYEGFALSDPSLPTSINVLAGERVLVTYGDRATAEAVGQKRTLADNETFASASEALGEDLEPSFFVDLGRVVSLAESMGAGREESYQRDVKPLLEPLSFIVAGTQVRGQRLLQRLVIGVE